METHYNVLTLSDSGDCLQVHNPRLWRVLMSIHSQIVKSVMSSQLKTVRISDFVSFQQSVYGEQINNHRTHYLNQILGSDMICIANSTRSPKSHMHMATNFILKVKCHSGSCNLWGLPGGCSKIDNAFNL